MSILHTGDLVKLKYEDTYGIVLYSKTYYYSKKDKTFVDYYWILWDWNYEGGNITLSKNIGREGLIYVSSGFSLSVSDDFFDFRKKLRDRVS